MAPVSAQDKTAWIAEHLGKRSIVLVGLMGAGKSSIGKRLAQRLGVHFVDADTAIETAAGMTIPEIFATHGEAYFRSGEVRVIARLLHDGPQVLATGGGAFMNATTRDNIASMGISLWLKGDFDVLMARVRKRTNRPLLQASDPEAVMRQLISDRYPVYGLSDVMVQSRDIPHHLMVDEVINALYDHMTRPQAGAPSPAEAQLQGETRP